MIHDVSFCFSGLVFRGHAMHRCISLKICMLTHNIISLLFMLISTFYLEDKQSVIQNCIFGIYKKLFVLQQHFFAFSSRFVYTTCMQVKVWSFRVNCIHTEVYYVHIWILPFLKLQTPSSSCMQYILFSCLRGFFRYWLKMPCFFFFTQQTIAPRQIARKVPSITTVCSVCVVYAQEKGERVTTPRTRQNTSSSWLKYPFEL